MLDMKRARDESGVMMVFFAILLPLILLMGVVTIDIGNWWVHKRHLQTQVDAAALAAGPQFVGCFLPDQTPANEAIRSRALAYAGDTLRPGQFNPGSPADTTNLQVQQPNDVRAVLNSQQYWTGGATDGSVHDFTLGTPCATSFLDVKATDDEAPLLWGLLPFVASPKARAKIEIQDIQTARGMLPWAVPEIEPRAVVALFVNEDTGAVFDFQQLNPTTLGPAFWSNWTTSVGQEAITFDGVNDNTGVVILVSKNDPTPATGGTLASICSQDPGLVTCYGGSSATSGLSFIHGYNGGFNGTLASPQVRQVELFATGCSAADLSAAYFTLDGNCSAAVEIVLDFGFTGDPTQHPQCARVPGYTWNAGGIGGARGTWSGSINLPAGSGRNEIAISGTSGPRNGTECGNPGQQPNSFSRPKVHAPYVADNASGPIQYLQLSATHAADGTPVGNANSVEKTLTYNYVVTVGLPKPHQLAANYTDPPVMLRMASPSGSQNQAWDCDRGVNFRDEIENGCQTTYIENYRDLDEDGDKEWNNILCAGYSTTNLPPTTFNPIPPEDCVITETGDMTGQLRDGLHDRLETPCFPNGWPDDATELAAFVGPNGNAYGTDPRYVTLIITDDTAFSGSGNEPLPIKYFAGFYVTGWDYHPSQSPGCGDPDGGGPLKGNDDHPIYGPAGSYNHSDDNGDVWGYFVDIVVFSSEGEPSGDLCTFGADPAACVATLVE